MAVHECRLQYIYTHVDKLNMKSDKMYVNMVTLNRIKIGV